MSNEAIKKLAKIFANQNKILKKLAASQEELESDLEEAKRALMNEPQEMGSFEDEEYKEGDDPELNMRNRGKRLLQQAINSGDGLPSDFDETLNHYKEKMQQASRNPMAQSDFRMTLNQLAGMAAGEEAIWGELGDYFPGWSPNNIRQLLSKLRG